jgi:hypothetical protein
VIHYGYGGHTRDPDIGQLICYNLIGDAIMIVTGGMNSMFAKSKFRDMFDRGSDIRKMQILQCGFGIRFEKKC